MALLDSQSTGTLYNFILFDKFLKALHVPKFDPTCCPANALELADHLLSNLNRM